MSASRPLFTLLLAGLLGAAAAGCRPGAPAEVEPAPLEAAEYAGDEACASCHEDLYAAYHRTGMGRSVSRFDPRSAPERFDAEGRGAVVYNDAFDLYYQALLRGDTLFQREFRLDEAGRVVHERVHRADYVVGSGNATRSYLMAVNGFVTEMPLTWYVERALWDMSPGYREVDSRFGRPINHECMSCHNGPAERSPFTQNHYADVPLGITCERCHGPSAAHVEARLAGSEPAEGEADPGTVNPARLERALQLSVCQQCHLEGVTVFRPGEDPTTFRPGEPLAAHRVVFARQEQVEDPERFGIASHGLRLAESACFERSAMTCTTCHDPHRPTAELGADWFNAVCQSCHGGPPAGVGAAADAPAEHEAVCSRPGAHGAEVMTGDCVSCHMQTGGTSDIPHVTFTDHWIRRTLPPRPPAGPDRDGQQRVPYVLVNVLERQGVEEARGASGAEDEAVRAIAYFHLYETKHRLPAYLPDVAARLRRALAAGAEHPEARLTLGRALLEMDSLAAAEAALAEAVRAHPEDAWALYWLGEARTRQGNASAALEPLRRAVEVQPLFIEARVELAEALAAVGEAAEAVAHLEAAVAADSVHHPAAWNNLGLLHLQAGRTAEAERALARAVALDPDLVEARVNLGTAHLVAERLEPAIEQFEAALRTDPANVPALGNLGVAYLRLDRPAEARRMFEALLALNPADRQARAYLAQLDG